MTSASTPGSSRPRSATTSPAKSRRRRPTFYLDESISQNLLATALRAAGEKVFTRAEAGFPMGVSDPEWLVRVGRRGWMILTKDANIRRRPNELAAIVKAGARAFVVAAAELTGPDQAALVVALLPRIRAVFKHESPPYIYRISRDKRLDRIYPEDDE